MSRSNPTAKNPATRFLQWSGGAEGGGQLTWYDKEAEERKVMELPFSFLVLDELTTITGFNEGDHSGYWSNEVRDQREELVVRTKSGIKGRGTYAQIKALNLNGLKYAQSVYVAFKDESGELVIGNIKMTGSSLTAWIEFKKKFDVYKCAVMLVGPSAPQKKGATTYFMPVFDGRNASDATNKAAAQLDVELQAYLSNYMARKPDDTEVVEDGPADEADTQADADDFPAAQEATVEKVEVAEKPAAKAETVEDDGPINLKDVPF